MDEAQYGRAVRLLLQMDIPVRENHLERLVEDGLERGLSDDLVVRILTERTEPTPKHPSSTRLRIHRLMKSRDLLDWDANGHVVARPRSEPPLLGGVLEAQRRIEAYEAFAKVEEVRRLRAAAGFSTGEIARRLGLTERAYVDWERGVKCPSAPGAVRWWAEVKPQLR